MLFLIIVLTFLTLLFIYNLMHPESEAAILGNNPLSKFNATNGFLCNCSHEEWFTIISENYSCQIINGSFEIRDI
jgi:hypothetical protein